MLQEIKEIQLHESDKEDAEEMDVSDEEDGSQPPRKKARQNEYLKVWKWANGHHFDLLYIYSYDTYTCNHNMVILTKLFEVN